MRNVFIMQIDGIRDALCSQMKQWGYSIYLWHISFWTCWSLSLFVITNFVIPIPSPLWLWDSTLMALCISSVGGFWITACKGHMRIEDIFPVVIEVDGIVLVMIDFISHHLPLYFHYNTCNTICSSISSSSLDRVHLIMSSPFLCHVLLFVYLYLNSVEKRYGAPSQMVVGGWIISAIMFISLKSNMHCQQNIEEK
jgi:hypothetical protein